MRSSIYDALEVNSASPLAAVKAALRAVVRRFWAVPRDASGDSEEAVRFAALAASILVDTGRRKDYDAALNPGVGSGPWRLPIGPATPRDSTEGSTNSRVLGTASEPSQLIIEAKPPSALPGVDALSEPLPDGKAWSSPLIWVAMAAAWALLLFACWQPLVEIFSPTPLESVLAAAGSGGLLCLLAMWLSRSREPEAAAAGLSRLAIIKWRREGSIFIGVPPPQHDTAWIFKLRLMELTRTAAGFITATSTGRRLTARLIDYSLTALLFYGIVLGIDQIVPILDNWFIALRSPLVLPFAAVLLAIPLEAMMYSARWSTPGKWLLGLVVVIGVTRPSDHVTPGTTQLAWARAVNVALKGAAIGFLPLALLRLPANLRAAREAETEWEVKGDSVVMARPMTMPAVATGLMLLLATSLLLVSGWRRDYVALWPQAVIMAVSAQQTVNGLLHSKADTATEPPAASATAKDWPPDAPSAPATPAASQPTTPAPAAIPSNKPNTSTTAPLVTVKKPVGGGEPVAPSSASDADAEMAKQASAAHARRLRIDGYARQAEAARRTGNYAGLQVACQRWTQDQPGSPEAWRCFGLAQFQNGAGREALPALRQALKLEPNDAQAEAAILKILRP